MTDATVGIALANFASRIVASGKPANACALSGLVIGVRLGLDHTDEARRILHAFEVMQDQPELAEVVVRQLADELAGGLG